MNAIKATFVERLLLTLRGQNISGDFYVVARKITESNGLSLGLSALALLIFYGLWFGVTLYIRATRGQAARPHAQVRVSPLAK